MRDISAESTSISARRGRQHTQGSLREHRFQEPADVVANLEEVTLDDAEAPMAFRLHKFCTADCQCGHVGAAWGRGRAEAWAKLRIRRK